MFLDLHLSREYSQGVQSTHSPDAVVAEVLGLSATGYSQTQITARTGIPRVTVQRWLADTKLGAELSELRDRYILTAGDELTAKWTKVNHRLVDRILEIEDDDAFCKAISVQQGMVAFGISRDKSHQVKQANITVNVTPFVILGSDRPELAQSDAIEGELA